MIKVVLVLLSLLSLVVVAVGQGFQPVELPKPDTAGGKPLMQVLKNRHTSRDFSADTLPLSVLSNLLWAACGVNRPEVGKRTAPSAMNWQEIDVFVTTAHGLFQYDPTKHLLRPVVLEDMREKTGVQPFVKEAPINLVYVADHARMGKASDADQDSYSAADAGFIAENVYLYCASEGLATVVRGSIDRPALAKAMKLRPEQRIILTQTIGYPKK